MKKVFAVLATIATTLIVCACASGDSSNKVNHDQTRARAEGSYTEMDN